jgi:hypothetical protein
VEGTSPCLGKAAAAGKRLEWAVPRAIKAQRDRGKEDGIPVREVGADDGHNNVAHSDDLDAPSSVRHPISCQAPPPVCPGHRHRQCPESDLGLKTCA